MRLLLEKGAKIEGKDERGRTVISQAVAGSYNVIIKRPLLDKGQRLGLLIV